MEKALDFNSDQSKESFSSKRNPTVVEVNEIQRDQTPYVITGTIGLPYETDQFSNSKEAIKDFFTKINKDKEYVGELSYHGSLIMSTDNKESFEEMGIYGKMMTDDPQLLYISSAASKQFNEQLKEIGISFNEEKTSQLIRVTDLKIDQLKLDELTSGKANERPIIQDTYVIVGFHYAGMHYEGFDKTRELVTKNPEVAIDKLMELPLLSDRLLKAEFYNLYKTSDVSEFKIDSFGDPVNENTNLIMTKSASKTLDVDHEVLDKVTLFSLSDKDFPLEVVVKAVEKNEFAKDVDKALNEIERSKSGKDITFFVLKDIFEENGFKVKPENPLDTQNQSQYFEVEKFGRSQNIDEIVDLTEKRSRELNKRLAIKNDIIESIEIYKKEKPSKLKSLFFPKAAKNNAQHIIKAEELLKGQKERIDSFMQKPLFGNQPITSKIRLFAKPINELNSVMPSNIKSIGLEQKNKEIDMKRGMDMTR